MESISGVSALYSIISAQQAARAEGQAALALLQSTMEVQQAIAQALASDSSVDIYV